MNRSYINKLNFLNVNKYCWHIINIKIVKVMLNI